MLFLEKSRTKLIFLSLAFSLGLGPLAISPVCAQSLPVLSDSNRFPPDLQYEPIRYKSFILEPKLETSLTYDTNIFATDTNEESDFIARISPSLRLEKKFGSAEASIYGQTTLERYSEFNDENRNNSSFVAAFDNDLNSRWGYGFNASYSHLARQREDPTGLGASENPLYIDTFNTDLKVSRTFNRLSLTLIGNYQHVSNDDGVAKVSNAIPVIFSVNDRQEYGAEALLIYDWLPGGDIGSEPQKAFYTRAGLQHLDYDENVIEPVSRDRKRITAFGGFIGRFAELSLTTDIGIGYIGQNFDDGRVDNTHDLGAFIRMKYVPDPKHIFSFDLSRDVTQDNVFVSGIVETDTRLVWDYEIKHDLFLKSQFLYQLNEFDDGRKDDDYILSLGMEHPFNKRLIGSVVFAQTMRESTEAGQDFERSALILKLTGRL